MRQEAGDIKRLLDENSWFVREKVSVFTMSFFLLNQSSLLKSYRFDYYAKLWTVFLLLITFFTRTTSALPSPEVQVDGYQEMEEPIYPFQQYIQVRKTYSVEHIPVYDGEPSTNLQTSASNTNSDNSEDHHDESSHSDGGSGDHYHVPRLRESIEDYKKQEVYEEKGYGDSDYDHRSYTDHNHGSQPSHQDYDHEEAGSSDAYSSNPRQHDGYRSRKPRRPLGPPVPSLHSSDGTSTKILEYAASNMYDKDAHEKGIYAARENVYCPEVIDFDLSSKSMAMGKGGRGGAKPRLKGLGAKITCLKNKYFGSNPLPRAIFPEPSESRKSVIEIPSFENFFKMVKKNVHSMSSFQHF